MAAAGKSVLVRSVADKGTQKRTKSREIDALKEENLRLKRNIARMQQILLLKTQICHLRPAHPEQDCTRSADLVPLPDGLVEQSPQTGSARTLQNHLRPIDRRAFY